MNPVARFEETARNLWRSELGRAEKGVRLKEVHSAILHYVVRMDERRQASGLDPWTSRSFDRLRSYLKHLAADVEDLALQCERAPEKSPKGTQASVV